MRKRVYRDCTEEWHNSIHLRDIEKCDKAVGWLRTGELPEDESFFYMKSLLANLLYDDIYARDREARFLIDREDPEKVRRMIGDILAHRDKLQAIKLWSPDDRRD